MEDVWMSKYYKPVAYMKNPESKSVHRESESARMAFWNADTVCVLRREVGSGAIFTLYKEGEQPKTIMTSTVKEISYDPKSGILDIVTLNSRYSLRPIEST